MLKFIKKAYRGSAAWFKGVLNKCFKRPWLRWLLAKDDLSDFPIYVISYNRLTDLKNTVCWLREYGYRNIIVIDNHSDYQPLIDYYAESGVKVVRMRKNCGHKVFYTHPRFWFKRNFTFFCLTDPDLAPIEDCPADFVRQFLRVMYDHPEYGKVGFSLKIDDLPDGFPDKRGNIEYESQFWTKIVPGGGGTVNYIARISTPPSRYTRLGCSRPIWRTALTVSAPASLTSSATCLGT